MGTLLRLFICLSFVSSLACQKKVEEEETESVVPGSPVISGSVNSSSKTATGVTLSWSAASDDVTAAANLRYKLVYSTSDNLTTAASAETNGTIALDWTVNALTANLSSLTHSKTYYLALLVKDDDNLISIEKSSITTMCTGKRLFLASVNNGSFGGKAGADAACTAQRPSGITGSAKAMIADATDRNGSGMPIGTGTRQVCHGPGSAGWCFSSNQWTYDWVLAANTSYCTSDFEKQVGTTGTYPVLTVLVSGVLSATPEPIFTGMNIYWGTSTTNCSNWSTTSGSPVSGSAGGVWAESASYTLITGGSLTCASAGKIVCAEQ